MTNAETNAPQNPAPPAPGNTQKNGPPSGIKIIAILFGIGGIMWIIYPFIYSYMLIFIPSDMPWYQWGTQLICCWAGSLILASLYFGIAAGLMKGMAGAWMWAVIFAIIGLFNFPIGTVISIIILIYLFRMKDQFNFEQMQQMQPPQPPQA